MSLQCVGTKAGATPRGGGQSRGDFGDDGSRTPLVACGTWRQKRKGIRSLNRREPHIRKSPSINNNTGDCPLVQWNWNQSQTSGSCTLQVRRSAEQLFKNGEWTALVWRFSSILTVPKKRFANTCHSPIHAHSYTKV